MKINHMYNALNISWINFLLLFCLCFQECNKSTDFSNKVYIKQSEGKFSIATTLREGKSILPLSVVSAKEATQDIEVKFSLADEGFVKSFNEEFRTEYALVPSSSVKLSSTTVSIHTGRAISDEQLTLEIEEWDGYVEGKQYVVPLKVSAVKGADILSGSEHVMIVVSKEIVSFAAKNSGFVKTKPLSWESKAGQPLGDITLEGRFSLQDRFIVSGNWRSDILVGFGFQLAVLSTGGIDIRLPNSAFMFSENPPGKINLGEWNHFAITYNAAGTIRFYLNGRLMGSTSYPGLTYTNNLELASYATGTGCQINEFRVWDHIRPIDKLNTFKCAVDPATPGLMAYWRFNEGTGLEAKDVSGNGNDFKAMASSVVWVPGMRCGD